MFAAYGVILTAFGVLTRGDVMYDRHSLAIDVNLWWGLVLLAFGGVMLALGLRHRGVPRGTEDPSGPREQ